MIQFKRLLPILLSLLLAVPSYATTIDVEGGQAVTQIDIEIAETNLLACPFSVTAPTAFPVTADNTGAVHVAKDMVIMNNSDMPVYIESVSVAPMDTYELLDWASTPADNSKQFCFKIFDIGSPSTGIVDVSHVPSIPSKISYPIIYDSKVPLASSNLEYSHAAEVTFKVGFINQLVTEDCTFDASGLLISSIKANSITEKDGHVILPIRATGYNGNIASQLKTAKSVYYHGRFPTAQVGFSSSNDASSVQAIYFAEGVSSIENLQSSNSNVLRNLEVIDLPASLTSIGEGCFYLLPKLKTVVYRGTEEQWSQVSIATKNTGLQNATVTFIP